MMLIIKNKAEYLILSMVLVLFTIYKIPHLSEPLFWDGMGVYGKSIFALLDNGIGFQPKYLDPELSRGHPMLYVFILANLVKLFGGDFFSMHLVNLWISLTTLLSVFYISSKLFNKKTAIFSVIVLSTQALFIAQSVLVLPEMMLALWVLWAVYFFISKRWFLYFLFTSLAMLTKETAIYLPFVLWFIDFVWNVFYIKKFNFKDAILIFSPFVVFIGFLILQKNQNGWYFFPYHNPFEGDKGFFDLKIIIKKGLKYIRFLTIEQGRFAMLIAILGLSFFTIKNMEKKTVKIIVVLISVIAGLILFSALNHYMNRYMLLGVVFFSVLVGFLLTQEFLRPIYQYSFLSILIICSLFHLKTSEFRYDENMSYLDFLQFQKEAVFFLEKDTRKEKTIFTSNFPLNFSFEDYRYGFCFEESSFENRNVIDDKTDYIIMTNPGSYEEIEIPNNFHLLDYQSSKGNIRIYKKN